MKINLIKISKAECKEVAEWLLFGGCPLNENDPGCGLCENVFPEKTDCPCAEYGQDEVIDVAIDLLERNNYEIPKEIVNKYIKGEEDNEI